MIETREYQDGDMEYVRLNPFQDEVKAYPEMIVPENSYTCVYNGEIVAVGGIRVFREGFGEAWVILTKQSRKDGIFGLIACRAIENKLNELIDGLKMCRVEANVRADFGKAIRFTEAIGFKRDCERKNFFPGGVSAILYSKVNDEYI